MLFKTFSSIGEPRPGRQDQAGMGIPGAHEKGLHGLIPANRLSSMQATPSQEASGAIPTKCQANAHGFSL